MSDTERDSVIHYDFYKAVRVFIEDDLLYFLPAFMSVSAYRRHLAHHLAVGADGEGEEAGGAGGRVRNLKNSHYSELP